MIKHKITSSNKKMFDAFYFVTIIIINVTIMTLVNGGLIINFIIGFIGGLVWSFTKDPIWDYLNNRIHNKEN